MRGRLSLLVATVWAIVMAAPLAEATPPDDATGAHVDFFHDDTAVACAYAYVTPDLETDTGDCGVPTRKGLPEGSTLVVDELWLGAVAAGNHACVMADATSSKPVDYGFNKQCAGGCGSYDEGTLNKFFQSPGAGGVGMGGAWDAVCKLRNVLPENQGSIVLP